MELPADVVPLLERLQDVPADLAAQIRRRRDGHPVVLGPGQRVRRAHLVRQIMRRGVRRLSTYGLPRG